MLIYFPQMHEELIKEKVEGASIFDPGIDRDKESVFSVFRPENLTVDPQKCRRMLDDIISNGESLGDMFKFIVNPQPYDRDQFGEKTSAIHTELSARISSESVESNDEDVRAQNQVVLALVYAYEEKHLELGSLEKNLSDKWAGFGESLWIDVDDEDERKAIALGGLMANLPGEVGSTVQLPWQKVLEGFALLLPENCVLVTSDVEAVSYWRDLDFEFYEKEGLLEEKALALREKTWKLLGLSSVPEDKPWLDREFTVVLNAIEDN